MKRYINQFLAIFSVEMKALMRQAGQFGYIIFLPFLFSFFTFGIGAGISGSTPSLEIWFYQIIGFTVLTISLIFAESSAWYVRQGLLTGRLEYLLASPTHPLIIVIATAFFNSIFALSIFFIVGMLATILVYGIIKIINFILSIFILILFLLPMLGINLIIAALTIIAKDPRRIVEPIGSIISTTSGFVYPITLLPLFLQILGKSLPFYYAVENIRTTIIEFVNLLYLYPLPLLLLYFIAGIIIYRLLEENFIRKRGTYGW
jgi:ABC-2 type transport system permease protein